MIYIKPKCQKLTNILDYLVIISIDMQNVTLTEQLNNTVLDKEILAFRLKSHKGFWIHRLKTLNPHEFQYIRRKITTNLKTNKYKLFAICIFSTILIYTNFHKIIEFKKSFTQLQIKRQIIK